MENVARLFEETNRRLAQVILWQIGVEITDLFENLAQTQPFARAFPALRGALPAIPGVRSMCRRKAKVEYAGFGFSYLWCLEPARFLAMAHWPGRSREDTAWYQSKKSGAARSSRSIA